MPSGWNVIHNVGCRRAYVRVMGDALVQTSVAHRDSAATPTPRIDGIVISTSLAHLETMQEVCKLVARPRFAEVLMGAPR